MFGRNLLKLPLIRILPKSNFCSEAEKAGRTSVHLQKQGTIFDKIISKEIKADIIYEDSKCLAFNDVAPQAPVHFLVIPKIRINQLEDASENQKDILGHLLFVAGSLGKERTTGGFRVVINNGANACQSVYHLHLHILGNRPLSWPPG